MKSDYLQLSQQYASFLVAIAGVSITVLAVVLSLGSSSGQNGCNNRDANKDLRAFLVAALVVATVSCFIGAQMMAETAAFISNSIKTATPETPALLGERLFLLASASIFIAIVLVLFALMLLLTTSDTVDADSMRPISKAVFRFVVIGASIWMILAANSRMPAPSGWWALAPAGLFGVAWGSILSILVLSKTYWKCKVFKPIIRQRAFDDERVRDKYLLRAAFIPIIIFMVVLLLYFAITFNKGDKVNDLDMILFSSFIVISYVSLWIASIKTMVTTKPIT
jgi:hypothetical protein